MGVIARYRERLPVTDRTPLIDLCEGSTPLIPSRNIGPALGLRRLFFKYEGLNPTGSFKDRGMVVAVAKAMEDGARVLVCASTGNTSASAAAYAASQRLRAIVLIPSGQIAMNKLAQAMLYGAKVVAISGNFDDALRTVREMADDYPIAVVNSINPYRIEGQKTAAFEIVDELGDAPDYLVLPVGNAGNITAYWKGFKEEQQAGRTTLLPRMVGAQAEGAAPIVRGEVVENPKTVATAIKIGNPASWEGAATARDESGGLIDAVSDTEILAGADSARVLGGRVRGTGQLRATGAARAPGPAGEARTRLHDRGRAHRATASRTRRRRLPTWSRPPSSTATRGRSPRR